MKYPPQLAIFVCAHASPSGCHRGEFIDAHDGMTPTPSYFLPLLKECIAEGDEESEHRWKPMLDAIRTRP